MLNIHMIWPIAIVVVANTFYNICAKSMPEKANPFLSLLITYLVAAVVCLILFLISTHGGSGFVGHLKNLNWTSIVLGFALVALEVGYVFVYRNGWQMGIGSLVANICLAVVLLILGFFLYKQGVTILQIIGVVVCIVGLILVTIGGKH